MGGFVCGKFVLIVRAVAVLTGVTGDDEEGGIAIFFRFLVELLIHGVVLKRWLADDEVAIKVGHDGVGITFGLVPVLVVGWKVFVDLDASLLKSAVEVVGLVAFRSDHLGTG